MLIYKKKWALTQLLSDVALGNIRVPEMSGKGISLTGLHKGKMTTVDIYNLRAISLSLRDRNVSN